MDFDIYGVKTDGKEGVMFKKKILPDPLPPVSFKLKETPQGISGEALTETVNILDTSSFSDYYDYYVDTDHFSNTVTTRWVEGQRVGANYQNHQNYSTAISNTSSNSLTALEAAVRKREIDKIVEEMSRMMETEYKKMIPEVFGVANSVFDFNESTYKNDWLDVQRYTYSQPMKITPSMKEFLNFLEKKGPPLSKVPPPEPDSPTQLELF